MDLTFLRWEVVVAILEGEKKRVELKVEEEKVGEE